MTAEAAVADWLEPIRARFVTLLAERKAELTLLVDGLDQVKRREEAAFILHRIAGVAGTVGHSEFGKCAKALEDRLHLANVESRHLTETEIDLYEDFLDRSDVILSSESGR